MSVLETIQKLESMGFWLNWEYRESVRIGDQVCYITDMAKARSHFPAWKLEYGLDRIFEDIAARYAVAV